MPLKTATFAGTYSLVDKLGNESEDLASCSRPTAETRSRRSTSTTSSLVTCTTWRTASPSTLPSKTERLVCSPPAPNPAHVTRRGRLFRASGVGPRVRRPAGQPERSSRPRAAHALHGSADEGATSVSPLRSPSRRRGAVTQLSGALDRPPLSHRWLIRGTPRRRARWLVEASPQLISGRMWSMMSVLDAGVSDTLVKVWRYDDGSVTGADRRSRTQSTPTRCPSVEGSVTTPMALTRSCGSRCSSASRRARRRAP